MGDKTNSTRLNVPVQLVHKQYLGSHYLAIKPAHLSGIVLAPATNGQL